MARRAAQHGVRANELAVLVLKHVPCDLGYTLTYKTTEHTETFAALERQDQGFLVGGRLPGVAYAHIQLGILSFERKRPERKDQKTTPPQWRCNGSSMKKMKTDGHKENRRESAWL